MRDEKKLILCSRYESGRSCETGNVEIATFALKSNNLQV